MQRFPAQWSKDFIEHKGDKSCPCLTWCVSPDLEFAAKAAEIVWLYLDPPEGALVVAVDEKPHIQALEGAQGYLKLPNGRALGGGAHDYKRTAPRPCSPPLTSPAAR